MMLYKNRHTTLTESPCGQFSHLGIKQELRSWFEVNAKFPSTTPRLNITFSFHDPQNKRYK